MKNNLAVEDVFPTMENNKVPIAYARALVAASGLEEKIQKAIDGEQPELTEVEVSSLTLDENLIYRPIRELSKSRVELLAIRIQSGQAIEPPVVYEDDGGIRWVVEGAGVITAYKAAELKSIKVYVFRRSHDEALRYFADKTGMTPEKRARMKEVNQRRVATPEGRQIRNLKKNLQYAKYKREKTELYELKKIEERTKRMNTLSADELKSTPEGGFHTTNRGITYQKINGLFVFVGETPRPERTKAEINTEYRLKRKGVVFVEGEIFKANGYKGKPGAEYQVRDRHLYRVDRKVEVPEETCVETIKNTRGQALTDEERVNALWEQKVVELREEFKRTTLECFKLDKFFSEHGYVLSPGSVIQSANGNSFRMADGKFEVVARGIGIAKSDACRKVAFA